MEQGRKKESRTETSRREMGEINETEHADL